MRKKKINTKVKYSGIIAKKNIPFYKNKLNNIFHMKLTLWF